MTQPREPKAEEPVTEAHTTEEPGRTVVGLIRALQSGEIAGPALPATDRRRVVEHLWAEGYSVPETAEIVRVAERTILRDRAAIRAANAVRPHEEFVPETVGALVRQADLTVARLRRVSRDKQSPAAARVDAELGCWTVTRELVSTLQELGYLPSAPKQVSGHITHRVEEAPSYKELQGELERIGMIVAVDGNAEVITRVGQMKDRVTRLALGEEVRALTPREVSDGR
jgi:hypothetical protein